MGLVKTRRLAYPPLAGFATHRKANTPSGASAERCGNSNAREGGMVKRQCAGC